MAYKLHCAPGNDLFSFLHEHRDRSWQVLTMFLPPTLKISPQRKQLSNPNQEQIL